MQHQGTRIIRTPRLTLRPATMEDAPAMYKNWASDPEVTKFLRWPAHQTIEITQRVIASWVELYQKPDYYHWLIVPDGLEEPIGSISVVEEIKPLIEKAEVGYCIGKSWWHQGIVSESFQAVISFLFEQVGVEKVEALHDVNNPHSGGVMKKCGLIYEGTRRHADINNQGVCDICIYGMLKDEYFGKKSPSAPEKK